MAAVPAGAPDAAGLVTWQQVQVAGASRPYLLAVPPGGGVHPLLVVLHGYGERTPAFLAGTGLVGAALAAGVAVAGPETPDRSWNDGRFGAAGRDDDAYITAVVRQLTGRGVADPRRVTLAGFSNGARMAVELSSRHPEMFAGQVLVGLELEQRPGSPQPTRPIPTVLVHGTRDLVQPWNGHGQHNRWLPAQLGVPQTVAAFLAAAHTSGDPVAVRPPHRPGAISVTTRSWRSGLAPVTLGGRRAHLACPAVPGRWLHPQPHHRPAG